MDSYVVFEVYYKHGEWNVRTFKSEKLLRDHIISRIEDYDDDHFYEPEHLNNLPLKDLIDEAIKYGSSILESQAGWGIVSVVKGVELK